MDITILLSERKGARQHIEVKAHSKERAFVFLQANTLQDAFDLIPRGKLEAFTAMANWKPEEKTEDSQDVKHFGFYPMAEETAQDILEAKENAGFYRSLTAAANFTKKKPNGIKTNEVIALVAKGSQDLATAIVDAYNAGYTRGYKAGEKKARQTK